MALIGIEGFDHYGSGDPTPFDNGNGPGSVTSGSDTRFNYGQAATSFGGDNLRWNFGSNQATVIQGMAIYANNPGDNRNVFFVLDGGSEQVHLTADFTVGQRRVNAYRSGTLLGQSAVNSLPPATNWMYLEWKVLIHSSAGTVEVRLDGNATPILNLTSQNTQDTGNSYATRAEFRNWGRNDDLYLFDGSGADNNDFAGNVRVFTEYPTSNDSVQFTPSAGSNYQNVDDPGDIDADSTYNSSATPSDKDTFVVTGDVTGNVYAVELRTTMRKSDASTCTGRGIIKSGGTQANGATRTFGTSYEQFRDYWDIDPTDSAAWTAAKANALKIGYERVT